MEAERPGGGTTRLGIRGDERGHPRLTTTVAAAGAAIAFSGAMSLAFEATGEGDGDVTTWPGTLISLAVVVAGYALLAVQRRGPLATAGVVAFAIGLPFFIGYATFDQSGFPPLSFDAIFGLSAVGWGVAYGVGPSRGRPFLLGLALLGAWWFVLEQVTEVFTAPFDFVGAFFSVPPFAESDGFEQLEPDGFGFSAPDPTEIAVVCGLVAVAYFAIGHVLERRGHHGTATPMVAVGHAAAIVAVLTVADDLQEIGTGLLAVVVGVLLAYRGATTSRRATTWIGGAYVVAGVQALVSGITDSGTGGGVLLLGLGAVLVVLAAFASTQLGEPDDDEPGPSFPGGVRALRESTGSTVASAGADAPRPGWWQASDGRWYPPEQHPDAQGGPPGSGG